MRSVWRLGLYSSECGEGILRVQDARSGKIFEVGRRETKVTLPGETELAGQFPDPLDVGVEDTESMAICPSVERHFDCWCSELGLTHGAGGRNKLPTGTAFFGFGL
ncbi:hypothetical protein NQZ68_016398 [Dissostichus eleginoides]|nr:hypothetical protein NQZ68_016398 [Dissostichus eleginoides]